MDMFVGFCLGVMFIPTMLVLGLFFGVVKFERKKNEQPGKVG